MRWQDLHNDPNTEPYTILHIRNAGELLWVLDEGGKYSDPVLIPAKPGMFTFDVFFRTYSRGRRIMVHGRDELDAFMQANKQLTKNKAAADRRRAKRTSTS